MLTLACCFACNLKLLGWEMLRYKSILIYSFLIGQAQAEKLHILNELFLHHPMGAI